MKYDLNAICHLHIFHNTPCLPPITLHNLCFLVLLGITVVPRDIKDNAYAKFNRETRCTRYFGKCENGEWRILKLVNI